MNDTDEDRSMYVEKVNGLEAAKKKRDEYLEGNLVKIRSLSDFENTVERGDYVWRVELVNDTVTMVIYDGAIDPAKKRVRLYFGAAGEPTRVDATEPSGAEKSSPCDSVTMNRSHIEFRLKGDVVYNFTRP